MIQAAGMYGSAAAGHCTCSSEKQADGCKFRKLSVHLSVRVVYICMHFSVCMVNQSFSDIKFLPPPPVFPELFLSEPLLFLLSYFSSARIKQVELVSDVLD